MRGRIRAASGRSGAPEPSSLTSSSNMTSRTSARVCKTPASTRRVGLA